MHTAGLGQTTNGRALCEPYMDTNMVASTGPSKDQQSSSSMPPKDETGPLPQDIYDLNMSGTCRHKNPIKANGRVKGETLDHIGS